MERFGLIVTAERRKHPVYKYTVYWGTLERVADKKHVFQIGPYISKLEALSAARKELDSRQD